MRGLLQGKGGGDEQAAAKTVSAIDAMVMVGILFFATFTVVCRSVTIQCRFLFYASVRASDVFRFRCSFLDR